MEVLKSDGREEAKYVLLILIVFSFLTAMFISKGNGSSLNAVAMFVIFVLVFMPKGLKTVRERDGLLWFKSHFSPIEQSIDPKSITRIDYIFPRLAIECGERTHLFFIYTVKRESVIKWAKNITNKST